MNLSLPQSMAFLAEFSTVDLVPAAGMLMLITGLLMIYRKRRRRQLTDPCLTPQEQLERNRQLRGVQGDLERLMVEIEQFSKRLATQLDAKAIAVELMLKQADQRIAELKRLSTGNGHGDASPPPPRAEPDSPDRQEPRTPPSPAELPSDPVSRSVYQLADQGLSAEAIAKRLNEHVGKIELILALRAS